MTTIIPCCQLKIFLCYILSGLFTKQTERTGQDYNVVLYTVVASTWVVATGNLWRECLGKRKRTLPYEYYSHFRKHMKENSLKWRKWQKILLKVKKYWKISPKLKNVENDEKNSYKIYISITRSSAPEFIYLKALYRIQGKKDVIKTRHTCVCSCDLQWASMTCIFHKFSCYSGDPL